MGDEELSQSLVLLGKRLLSLRVPGYRAQDEALLASIRPSSDRRRPYCPEHSAEHLPYRCLQTNALCCEGLGIPPEKWTIDCSVCEVMP